MNNREAQFIAKQTMNFIKKNIMPGMKLAQIRKMCEDKMMALGADSFWYWNVGAFVFSGNETTKSISGKVYKTSDRCIKMNDIVKASTISATTAGCSDDKLFIKDSKCGGI